MASFQERALNKSIKEAIDNKSKKITLKFIKISDIDFLGSKSDNSQLIIAYKNGTFQIPPKGVGVSEMRSYLGYKFKNVLSLAFLPSITSNDFPNFGNQIWTAINQITPTKDTNIYEYSKETAPEEKC